MNEFNDESRTKLINTICGQDAEVRAICNKRIALEG
jgi:hypothetical protein